MLPTLADRLANTARPLRGSSGNRCFISKAGPMALTANACAMWAASIWRQVFSGSKPLPCKKPVASITSRSSAPLPATALAICAAAASMLASAVMSSVMSTAPPPGAAPRPSASTCA